MATRGDAVVIVEDCRVSHIATGQTGTFEGYYDLETGADRNAEPWNGNPRIRLQDGSVIWGIECWWRLVEDAGPLPQMQEELAEHKEMIIKAAGLFLEKRE